MSAPAAPLLRFLEISRSFGSERALDRVTFTVGAGEVVAVLGENGAGKSTLMNVLYGLLAPDSGQIEIDGRPARIASPRDARRLGIGMVHQHFALAPGLTVAENFVLDEGGRALLHYPRAMAERRVRTLAAEAGLEVDPGARIADLSVGDRQRAEILKALKGEIRLLVLDEPTATLTPRESDELLRVVRGLSARGRSCLFISHKLDEVRAIAERVVVLRRGQVVAERSLAGASNAELAELMVGERSSGSVFRGKSQAAAAGPVRLAARALSVAGARGGRPAVDGVDLEVRAGEIVGITGVDGNGQGELCRVLAGLGRAARGEVLIDGRAQPGLTPRRAAALGIGHIPGDRRGEGLVAGLGIGDNLVLKHLRRPELGGRWLDRRRVGAYVRERIERYDLRPADPAADVGRLSGGNQQRVVLARELSFEPRIVIAENPTRGLDIGAGAFVLGELDRARMRGAAVLLVSTELDDVLELADRLLVMHRGRLTPTPARDRPTLGLLMAGASAGAQPGSMSGSGADA